MSRLEALVALRYLAGRRGSFVSVISVFSFIGILLGVGTLIVVMAVMNGFRNNLIERILGFNGHITAYAPGGGIESPDALALRISETEGVRFAFPLIQEQLLLGAGGRVFGVGVRGIRARDLALREQLSDSVDETERDAFARGGILLGERLAERYALTAGDTITLFDTDGNQTILGTLPRQGSFRVAGTFALGFNDYDSNFIFLSLPTAQRFLRMEDEANAIEIFVHAPEQVPELRARLEAELGEDWRFVDWQQANNTFLNALQVERNVMFLILSLIILVAAFNVVSGQYMLANDKVREVAILRTMGITRGAVVRIFLTGGGLIGIAGVLGGLGLGILITDNIETIQSWIETFANTEVFNSEVYYLTRLPAERNPVEVAVIVCLAGVISILAPLWPAVRAARTDPVEVLRHE